MSDLKLCPFHNVHPDKCGCLTVLLPHSFYGKASKWNTRPIEDDLRAQLASVTAFEQASREGGADVVFCDHKPFRDELAALRAEVAQHLSEATVERNKRQAVERHLAERDAEVAALKAMYEGPLTRDQAFDYYAKQWGVSADRMGVSDYDIETLNVIDAAIRKVRRERGKP